VKPKTLLVLTAVVAALVAFIWFVERDLPSSEERAERANRVLPVEPDEVAAVAIEWGGETVRLERRAAEVGEEVEDGEEAPEAPATSEWRLTEPYAARADRTQVETLLDALTGLRKSRTLEEVERAEVGLEAPRGGVTLTTADGELRLLVGAGVPGSDNVIVALVGEVGEDGDGDGEAWVTSGSFLGQLEREPSEWRSREVVSAAREDVERVRLRGSGEAAVPVVMARRGERFHLEEPFEDPVSSDAAERLLADLVTLQARRFLDGDPRDPHSDAELGLAPPRGTVDAELAGGGSVRVELGAPVEDPSGEPGAPDFPVSQSAVYARVGELRFEAVTGLSEAVARPAGEWRSPSWTAFRSFEVDRLEIDEPGEPPLVLVRAGVDWTRGEETIPYTAASDLLFALTEAEGAVADVEVSEEPLLTVRLATEEGDEETLTVYPAVPGPGESPEGWDEVHPARSSARSSDLLLPGSVVTDLLDALAQVRSAEPEP
jgi:hypothetical protein